MQIDIKTLYVNVNLPVLNHNLNIFSRIPFTC